MMLVFAAVDLRGGHAVQLVGGRPEQERITLPDPVSVARRWVDEGFEALHIVDLDAALGTGSNRDIILEIRRTLLDTQVQVGGGVRDDAALDAWMHASISRVVVGTRAIRDREWLERAAWRWPDSVVVAADIRGDRIVTHGWTTDTELDVTEFLNGLDPLPLGGVLVTDVSREGSMQGIDTDRFRRLVRATKHVLIAAGGIATPDDLHALRDADVWGAVVGMALYTGAITADAANEVRL